MKKLHFLFHVLFFLFVAACSSSKVVSFYVESESQVKFKTFSFYKRNTSNLNARQIRLDSLIENIISDKLKSKGYLLSYPSEAYVSFQITASNTSTSEVNNPYYYRRTYYPYYNNDVTVTQYKEGVFLIELYDQNDKLIWQGSKSFKERDSKNIEQLLLQNAAEITDVFKSKS